MSRNMKLAVLLMVMLLPASLHAAFEVESVLKADIGAPILDVTTNPAEELVFVLTSGDGADLFDDRSSRPGPHSG